MKTAVKQPLRLVNGKFMRGNIEEPVEIGNLEQIALLQHIEREQARIEKKAKSGELEVEIYVEDIEYKVVCEFECVCGNSVQDKDRCYTDDWEDLEDPEYEGGTITCNECGKRYEIIDNCRAKLIEQ